jgi:hypothetical protein
MKRPPNRAVADEAVRPRGRPKADQPCTSLTTWIPTTEYDRLVKLAASQDQSLSKLVRQWLAKKR